MKKKIKYPFRKRKKGKVRKKRLVTCMACQDTGKNSKGGVCVACQTRSWNTKK